MQTLLFQSQTGAIRRQWLTTSQRCTTSFNPKLVRLEVLTPQEVKAASGLFQSQTGAIRSFRRAFAFSILSFNPKLVRLEVRILSHYTYMRESFNPKLVRLEG